MTRRSALSLGCALLLIVCAFFACLAVFGFAFAIGDGGGTASPGMETFFDATLVGAVGLLIAAFGSWTSSRIIRVVALAGVLVVLPATVLSCWEGGHAFWYNTQIGFHYGVFAWASVLLPIPLNLAALVWTGMRLRESLRVATHKSETAKSDLGRLR